MDTKTAERTPFISQSTVVEFPEKDESVGELRLTYMGPETNDFMTRKVWATPPSYIGNCTERIFQALDILSTYLTSSAVAPLDKEYIETENPLW